MLTRDASSPGKGYLHSAYRVTDLDAIGAGGSSLAERGYQRVWGIGRHVQGSQLFDCWRDPDKLMVEHFADGDMFDSSIECGWAPMSASGLAQWGPPVTRDFLGTSPSPARVGEIRDALHADDNDLTTSRLLIHSESDVLLTTSIFRTADGWWVEDPKTSRALKVATKASTTAELLADRPAIADAAATLASGKTTEVAELALLSARDRAEQCRRPDGELPHAREGLRLRPEQKWDIFFRREAKNPRYFQNGDVIAARIATDDEQSTSANREIESTTRDDRRNPERGAALDSPLAAPQRTGRCAGDRAASS